MRPRLGRPRPGDVGAGLVTGLFSIPEGMAYASIAGFNPIAGLFAGVVPAVVGSLTARTVLMVTTLTSAIALTANSVLTDARLEFTAGNIAALAVLTGLVMLLLGLLRLGVVLNFVSHAVMTGFSLGIAVQIIVGVLKDATGYHPQGGNKLVQLADALTHIGSWQAAAVAVSAGTVVVWAVAHLVRRLQTVALLAAMVVVTAVVAILGTHVELVSDIADIPAALPKLSLPDWGSMPTLAGGAVAVALVALAQAASIAPSVPNPDRSRTDTNSDFVSQGLANVAGGLFQALPVGGSLSRTGVSVSAGAKTRWAGIFSGVWLALIVLAFAPLAERIPMPVIGGLIMVVGAEIIYGRRRDVALVWRTSKLSTAAMVVTFLATTGLPLQRAIILGAVLSLLLYCVQAARQAHLVALVQQRDGKWRTSEVPKRLPGRAVTVLHYGGASLFAELPGIDQQWPDPEPASASPGAGPVVVLSFRGLPDVPSATMIKVLHRRADQLREAGGRLMIAGATPLLAKTLEASQLTDALGPDSVFVADETIFAALDHAVAGATTWLQHPAQ
ncbi:MAG: SulP family inorganic anion transporter [Hamadaea sp.]|uniref:SulP family inorganic anion transporter n=1 Tax=Hamadaea sp. TaxID=2024425 RepID=UPI00185CC2FC|nr:SulP family inorganic anion transporter [Hamadaea sp.]NUR72322.1 SulP family inorganic anion transporter [Hamadaea sp.]NUT18702.1 SulP family inorganic anion transporter [Hamadaea sp.]